MSRFTLEIHVTPQNKNGEWGKRVKSATVAGFDTKQSAKNGVLPNVKHLCKLTKRDTDTFFVETMLLCDGKYVDCDNSVVIYYKASDTLETSGVEWWSL